MSFWEKRIKSVKKLSNATGIEEQKIKELKEGKREIGGETMEKLLKAINDGKEQTTLEKQVKEQEVVDWLNNTDLKQKLEDFGYVSQKECAKAIGIAPSSLNEIINRLRPNIYTAVRQKVYDFFQDDFNKKPKIFDNIDSKKLSDKDKIKLFFDNNTLKAINNKLGTTDYELASKIGVSRPSLQNFFGGRYKYISLTMKKAYDNITKLLNEIKEEDKKDATIDKKDIDNINTQADTKTSPNEAKNDQIEEINEEPTRSNDNLEDLNKKLREKTILNIELLTKLDKRDKKIEKLENQIRRYEILIDRLK